MISSRPGPVRFSRSLTELTPGLCRPSGNLVELIQQLLHLSDMLVVLGLKPRQLCFLLRVSPARHAQCLDRFLLREDEALAIIGGEAYPRHHVQQMQSLHDEETPGCGSRFWEFLGQ